MPLPRLTRRAVAGALLASPLLPLAARAAAARSVSITDFGAKPDDSTINTKMIQAAIDSLASKGGGTVNVPAGVFVTGALFMKAKVNLHLAKDAVLKCSTDLSNFPVQRTRIEGHFEPAFNPALINASNCDGFQLTGEGTLDGDGQKIWDAFFAARAAYKGPGSFPNVGVPRARMAILENCKNILVEGVTFKDSQYWNLHIYASQDVMVRNVRFQVPDEVKQAPSTDGIDLDSCQRVTIDGCYFSVTDDCIACKGSKGPFALDDKTSPPVETIRIRNCTFKRGGGVMTCGSEATIVRDVIAENCTIIGEVRIATIKLRPDTPQHYEDIHYRNITVNSTGGSVITMQPWTQYFDLQGQPPPQSIVKNITFTGIKGTCGSLGVMKPNPGQTTISDIVFKDIDLTVKTPLLNTSGVTGLVYDNVVVNGVTETAPPPTPAIAPKP